MKMLKFNYNFTNIEDDYFIHIWWGKFNFKFLKKKFFFFHFQFHRWTKTKQMNIVLLCFVFFFFFFFSLHSFDYHIISIWTAIESLQSNLDSKHTHRNSVFSILFKSKDFYILHTTQHTEHIYSVYSIQFNSIQQLFFYSTSYFEYMEFRFLFYFRIFFFHSFIHSIP